MEGVRNRKRGKDSTGSSETIKLIKKKSDYALPTSASFGIFLTFLVFLKLVLYLNTRLPTLLKVADEIKQPDRFIGERAEQDLLKLVSLGPKVTGSFECEVLAIRVLRQEIAVIGQTANPMHLIVQDLQKPKGSFHAAIKPHGFQSIYENIQNIAVRLGPNPPSNHSILVNCHFDTVPESPGASDNGLNCAVMLEVLRKMSRLPDPLRNNIIFLFNGAEEQFLQAAHGFITKHFWSKEVRVVINLDSGGAGGREFVFQAAPDHQWLLRAYAKSVPRPSASLAGQELFDSGLIPSDTDYRIFRDFGNTPGIDIAHIDNGYIYHTRFDTMDHISPGVYQHTGDNIQALLQELAAVPEVENVNAAKDPGYKLVYYDLFGFTMFVYTHITGVFINLIVVILTFLSVCKIFKQLPNCQSRVAHSIVVSALTALLSAILGTFAVVSVAYVVDYLGGALSWYSKPFYILSIYVLPYISVALLPWTRQERCGFLYAFEYFCGGQILTSLALLGLTLIGIRSSYLLMFICVFPALAAIMYGTSHSVTSQFAVMLGSSLIGVSLFLTNAISLFMVILPIMGRSGSTLNPELVVGGFTCVVCFAVGNVLIPVLMAVKQPRTVVAYLSLMSAISIILIVFTPLGFPYSANPKSPALQRFYIFHTDQKLYDRNGTLVDDNSGVFVLPMDRNKLKYVEPHVPLLKNIAPPNCERGLFCQFPIYNGRHVKPAKTSVWLPLTSPSIQYQTQLNLTDTIILNSSSRRLSFRLTGPDHITLVISPRAGVSLINWTLGAGREAATYEGREYYVVYISDGQVGDITTFTLTLEADSDIDEAWMDISVIGHYQHQKATYTSDFKDFINSFPDWSHVTSWVTSVNGYEF